MATDPASNNDVTNGAAPKEDERYFLMKALGTTRFGPILDALRRVGDALGMDAATDVSGFPKVYLRSEFE